MPIPPFHPSPYNSPNHEQRLRQLSLPMSGSLATIKTLGQKAKPLVEIQLTDEQKNSPIPSYTSSDRIRGEISITAQTDLTFEEIYVSFEGHALIWVEKLATTAATSNRSTGHHLFLRLHLPLVDPPRSLEAHKTYKLPFLFVVPEALLPQSCGHSKKPGFPELGHRRLPPSLGDPIVSNGNRSVMDDMAPEMATVAYSVRCRLTDGLNQKTGKIITMAEASKKLRICPAVPEEPPMHVEGGSRDDYILRREKGIKKGFGRSKLGRLVVESAEPKSLRLPSVHDADTDAAVTTLAIINVRFDPAESSSCPPQLGSVTSKMKVATFYATTPLEEIPKKSSEFLFDTRRGLYIEKIPLSSRCLLNVQWQKHDHGYTTPPDSRRQSMLSAGEAHIPAPSEAYNQQSPFYTATVIVPISLPKCNRVFVPTFHSCFISRIYMLKFTLSVSTPNRSLQDPTIHLKLPIQVSQEGRPQEIGSSSTRQAETSVAQEFDDIHNPRSIAPPTPALTERSSIPGSPRPSPRAGFSNRDSIAEESQAGPTTAVAGSDAGFNPQLTIDEDIPPSPGPGWSYRPSLSVEEGRRSLPPATRSQTPTLQQRFGSLSFEGDDDLSSAPPPEYSGHSWGRYRSRMSSHGTACDRQG